MFIQENKIGMVKSCITREPVESGESLEEMVRRCTATNEPIEATAPMIYTEEKDGVQPQYDIRADRFDLALDAIDKYDKSVAAQSAQHQQEAAQTADNNVSENNG